MAIEKHAKQAAPAVKAGKPPKAWWLAAALGGCRVASACVLCLHTRCLQRVQQSTKGWVPTGDDA